MPETKGTTIEFKAGDKKEHGYLIAPKTSRGGVLVLHAWWGLNNVFKTYCNSLAAEGYTAFAPDLHQGKIAKTIDEAKALMEIMEKDTTGLAKDTVLGSLEYLRSHPTVKGNRVGVVGFSMGAYWALWLSTQKPSEIAAVTLYYGTGPADFSTSQSSYLGHFSPEDEWEPADNIRTFQEEIRAAKRPVSFHFYPGTKHWFVEEDRPEFNPQAARLAWTRTIEFLNTTLPKRGK